MNYLIWDYQLERMAKGWIFQCKKATDNCDFICNNNPKKNSNNIFNSQLKLNR